MYSALREGLFPEHCDRETIKTKLRATETLTLSAETRRGAPKPTETSVSLEAEAIGLLETYERMGWKPSSATARDGVVYSRI
jgi:hypothetical protein